MADYYTKVVLQPEIPDELLTEDVHEKLAAFFNRVYDAEHGWYMYSEDYNSTPVMKGANGAEVELTEADLFDCLQKLIRRSNGRLNHFTIRASWDCTDPLRDAYGGHAVFITADAVKTLNTTVWLEQQIYRLNEHDCRPRKKRWRIGNVRQDLRDNIFYIAEIVEGGTRVAQVVGIGREQAEERAKLVVQAPNLLKELRLMVIQCPCGTHADGIDFNRPCPRCAMALEVIEKAQ